MFRYPDDVVKTLDRPSYASTSRNGVGSSVGARVDDGWMGGPLCSPASCSPGSHLFRKRAFSSWVVYPLHACLGGTRSPPLSPRHFLKAEGEGPCSRFAMEEQTVPQETGLGGASQI